MILKLSECRVTSTLNVIRGKWKPLIIRALKSGNLCYGELRRRVPEPSKKVMTAQLRELEKDRIISRSVFFERVVRVEYSLTRYGQTLVPILVLMNEWGQRHRDYVLHADKGLAIEAVLPSLDTQNERRQAAN